ncbi:MULTISPECIES: DUF6064 family protein [Thiorhodovibrio]|uniref:DUF6064 family protein n=1 Tax=Thiorhodovibrio TaxID=61593 RepID=UPI001913B411|nr:MULTISPECIES: DUF6064 family protein [Thiorhodovibrio]MBK5968039.1 hypothetical protein [Thiorhodovibrio winogradskyi]WPL11855.1 hypothetical protein Thiosp_01607 [Thiorhodovibrio litoralis]
MGELSSYALSDFIAFSSDTYLRLFARLNAELTPLVVAAWIMGLAMLLLVFCPSPRRRPVALALLGMAWMLCAWAYHWRLYRELLWAADWFAVAFALQGAVLMLIALSHAAASEAPLTRARRWPGLALCALGLIGIPALQLGLEDGRSAGALAWFGSAPDPTTVVTLGVLLLLSSELPWQRWIAWPIPLFWCLISSLTQAGLGLDLWPLMAALAIVALVFEMRAWRGFQQDTQA